MKTIATIFNNNQDITNADTNEKIARIECEKNVCEKELHRLQYGLKKLLGNMDYDSVEIEEKTWTDQSEPYYRRWNKDRNDESSSFDDAFISATPLPHIGRRKRDSKQNIAELRTSKTIIDPTNKSLLYKILEAKLLDCFSPDHRIDKNPSDSISNISSLESSSISTISSKTPTPTMSKLTPENNMLEVNDYKKSRLTVPTTKTSPSKKSKKKNKRKVSNKKPNSSRRKKQKRK